jgi:hypothetical protein
MNSCKANSSIFVLNNAQVYEQVPRYNHSHSQTQEVEKSFNKKKYKRWRLLSIHLCIHSNLYERERKVKGRRRKRNRRRRRSEKGEKYKKFPLLTMGRSEIHTKNKKGI